MQQTNEIKTDRIIKRIIKQDDLYQAGLLYDRIPCFDFDGNRILVPEDDDRSLRRWCCGSTDVPKIMGTNPYSGPFDLFHHKLNNEVVRVNPAMTMGSRMEPIFREMTQESLGDLGLDPDDQVQEGITIYEPTFMVTLRATPDAILRDNKNVCFEFKRHRYDMREDYGEPMTNEVHPMEYDQVQWHMYLGDFSVCFVGVLFGGDSELVWWKVERDDARIAMIKDAVFTFWTKYLHRRQQPSPDPTKACLDRLKRIEEKQASRRVFSQEEWELAVEHDRLSKAIKELEVAKKEAEAKIRVSAGDMQEIYIEDGKSKITLKAPKGRDTRTLRVSIKD